MTVGRVGLWRSAAAGLLIALMAGRAAMATTTSVEVVTGTTIVPPAAIEIVAGAGGTGTSAPATLAWWTNDEAMAITAVASDLWCIDVACIGTGTPDRIPAAALHLVLPVGDPAALDRSTIVAGLEAMPSEAPTTATLVVTVDTASARPGRYVGSLRFAVVDPARGGRARTAAGPDGSALIASPVVVVVR